MTHGRPLAYDPEQALERAMDCFWQHGYEATSLQDLLKAMRLSKSSLYQAFGGKQALFRKCLDHYRAQLGGALEARLREASSARGFLEELVLGIAAESGGSARRGCLLMNSAVEFGQRDRKVAGWIREGLDSVLKVFVAAVERGQREGGIRAGADARVLARYLMGSIAGLRTLLKAGIDGREARDTARVILGALD